MMRILIVDDECLALYLADGVEIDVSRRRSSELRQLSAV
jgi:hypothetical protein